MTRKDGLTNRRFIILIVSIAPATNQGTFKGFWFEFKLIILHIIYDVRLSEALRRRELPHKDRTGGR
jgi:hypothetical protein